MSGTKGQLTTEATESAMASRGKFDGRIISMQTRLRQAIFDSISEHDVAEIVKRQIAKAKEGDNASLQFVMKYVLGFGTAAVTLNQINVVTTDES